MRASQILILDDDPAFRARVREGLGGVFEVTEAGTEDELRALWVPRRFDLLLLDMRLRRDREGLDVLREVFAQDDLQPVIMVSAYGDTESAIEAVGAGAMMFLHKQEFSPALLGRMAEAVIEQGRLRRQVQGLRRLAWAGDPDTLLGESAGIREAAAAVRLAAGSDDAPALIVGERGCGASLAARLIHRGGERADGPFLEVAGAQTEDERNFYEGRLSPWIQTLGGTLAVDGAEALGQAAGRKILTRGENEPHRVVFMHHLAAGEARTKGERRSAASQWLFAENLLPVRLPPLRERREDIPLLATHFLQRQRAGGHTTARSIGGAAMTRLEEFSWPGNVRELRNAVEYATLQAAADARDEVGSEHLPTELAVVGSAAARRKLTSPDETEWDYRWHLARTELELADRAIRERGIAQKTALARALGYTDRFTFGRRISKALADFPSLGREFQAAANLFR